MSFTMYSTAWCGYCHRLKRVLERDGITFAEVDIDLTPQRPSSSARSTGGTRPFPRWSSQTAPP